METIENLIRTGIVASIAPERIKSDLLYSALHQGDHAFGADVAQDGLDRISFVGLVESLTHI